MLRWENLGWKESLTTIFDIFLCLPASAWHCCVLSDLDFPAVPWALDLI